MNTEPLSLQQDDEKGGDPALAILTPNTNAKLHAGTACALVNGHCFSSTSHSIPRHLCLWALRTLIYRSSSCLNHC